MSYNRITTIHNPFHAPVHFTDVTDSTMNDARDALISGASHGEVFVARTQRSGRGRLPGRKWEDGGNGALLFTLILDKAEVPIGLPLTQLLALAICRYLEKVFGLAPSLKWPNDVLIDGSKVAGILVETQGDYYLAGMGVNLSQTEFPNDLRRPATSITLVIKNSGISKSVSVDPGDALETILRQIRNVTRETLLSESLIPYLDPLNRPVTVLLGDPGRLQRLRGIVEGVANDGALIIRSFAGERHFVYSGELEFPPEASDLHSLNKKS